MNLPSLLLGLVFSTLVGAVFHLLVGGGAGRLLLFFILGWGGFWAGHFLAWQMNLNLFTIGSLHLGPALAFSLVCLVIGHWLSLSKRPKESK